MRRPILILALLALSAFLPAQRAALRTPVGGDLLATLRAAVDAYATDHGVPGIGCALRRADGSVVAFGVGLADVENDVPVTDRTSFRLASISKPFTAVTALRLSERGAFDLDRPVHEFVRGWPEKRWPVTPRLLLGHLGGVRHYRGEEMRSNVRYASVTAALSIFAADSLEQEPGTKYRYTTYGFNLLGAAIEAATGRAFFDVLRAEVLELAGCETLRIDDAAAIIPHRAQGYRSVGGQLANAEQVDLSNKIPGGGLCSTPTDLVRFAGAIVDGVLLRPATVDAMWTSMATTDGETVGYGMGWTVRREAGRRVAYHGGAQPRVSTMLWIDRESRTAVALMANLEGEGAGLRTLAPELVALVVGGD